METVAHADVAFNVGAKFLDGGERWDFVVILSHGGKTSSHQRHIWITDEEAAAVQAENGEGIIDIKRKIFEDRIIEINSEIEGIARGDILG